MQFMTESSFFQNEVIFVQINELDRISHAQVEFNYSLRQTQKAF